MAAGLLEKVDGIEREADNDVTPAPAPSLGTALAKVALTATSHLATTAATAVSPTAQAGEPSSDLAAARSYLLHDILGLDQSSSKLVDVDARRIDTSDDQGNPEIRIELKWSFGAWPEALIDALPDKIFSIDVHTKLLHEHDYTIEIQNEIQGQLDSFVADYVAKAVGNVGGIEHGVAAAAGEALKQLLASEIMKPLSHELSDSLLDFDLPERADVADILGDGFDALRSKYFEAFVPELAKTYAKFGLSEILTTISSGLEPKWAVAIDAVGHGVLDKVVSNVVDNYFQDDPAKLVEPIDGVDFAETFGNAIAGLLVDFKALDHEIIDDLLGIDGDGFIDQQITELLSHGIEHLVKQGFVDSIEFLSGKFEATDLESLFNQFSDQFSIAEIRGMLGDFFVNYAGNQLAQLFVNIDSLPEALVSQLGSVIGSGVLGEAIGSVTMGAVGDLFGVATWGAIGTSIFNGLGAILGAGIGAAAGSVVFELLDDLFDGAISGLFNKIVDWIRNDSPQAFYQAHYDAGLNQFVHVEGYDSSYSKDSNDQMRAAVKGLSDAFTTRINAVIDFVGQKVSFEPYFDNVTMVWGKKHFDSKYAAFLNTEANKIGYSSNPTTVALDAIGATLHHMNFQSGNGILAKAYDMWKAQIAAGGGGDAAYASPNAFTLLQNIVGLAHFANEYRQDPTVFDQLMASDAPIAITILQEFLEAQAAGFNDATTLRGSDLGFEEIGSAAAGDTIILDGPAWRAVARGGNDTVDGGTHDDWISGGTGDDLLRGNAGADTIAGDEGDDKLYGGDGNDILNGGAGKDVVLGDAGNDRLDGGDGDDQVFGWTGDDSLFGGAGNDVMNGEDGNDRVEGGAGDDTLYGDAALAGADTLLGGEGNDTLYGGGGDDVLDGGEGSDISDGGAGNDWHYADETGDVVREVAGGGFDRVLASVSYTLAAGAEVEMLTTTDNYGTAAIDLTGNALDQAIYGNEGSNILIGGGGADDLIGFGGDDRYFVDSASDLVHEAVGGGSDRVLAAASYALAAGAEVEMLTTTDNFGIAAIDLTGNSFDQAIYGNDGANILTGGGGTDDLLGFGGNDWYFVDSASDRVYEAVGGGSDRVLASVSYTLAAGVEIEVLSVANSADTGAIDLTGNAFSQAIWGNDGINILIGGGGNDDLIGLGGNDIYYVDSASDRVYENIGGGVDRVFASISFALGADAAVEVLSATDNFGTAAIDLTGSNLAQAIYGNDAPNVLDGKGGIDDLIGFGGNDVYAFTTAPAMGEFDRIHGFVSGVDRISLDRAVFTALAPGALSASAFVLGTAALDADDRILYEAATGRLFYDMDGSGAAGAVQFALLTGGEALAASDFIIA